MAAKVGLGVLTSNRPDYFFKVFTGIQRHLTGVVDHLWTVEDGPYSGHYSDKYPRIIPGGRTFWDKRRGIAHGKNTLFQYLLAADCDWIFISEDDVVVQSAEAITGYIKAAEEAGLQHLNFHAHGPANPRPLEVGKHVTLWPNFVGAWSLYSRNSLIQGGIMDTHFYNAFEHVEHTVRLAQRGFTTAPAGSRHRNVADATGSENWIKEIPGAIANSVTVGDSHVSEAIEYWQAAQPDSYRMVFG
jgi:GT2 family glycosyltransferase